MMQAARTSKDVSHEFRDGPIRAYATDGCVRIEANDVESGDDAEVYLDVSEARAFHAWLGRVLGVHETSPQVTPYVCPECKIEAGFHEMTCSRWTASATHETKAVHNIERVQNDDEMLWLMTVADGRNFFPEQARECAKRLLDRLSVPTFENCRFEGDPPQPFTAWCEWARGPMYRNVTVRASEKTSDDP